MATPESSFDATDVHRLAETVGLSLSAEDAEAVSGAFAGHCGLIAPLFEIQLDDEPVATTYDPRWRA